VKSPITIYKAIVSKLEWLTRDFYVPLIEIMNNCWYRTLYLDDEVEQDLIDLCNAVAFGGWKEEELLLSDHLFHYFHRKKVSQIITSIHAKVEEELNTFEMLLRALLSYIYERHGKNWEDLNLKTDTRFDIEKRISVQNAKRKNISLL
jgi:hypothetical protein